jgi:DNA polymerase-3 subunit beta
VQSNKSSLPILDCVLFELAGGNLSMTASDSETTIVTNLEVNDADGEGRFAIESKQLINSIKEISDQPITFTINPDTLQVEINYQNGKYNLMGKNAAEYPLPVDGGETSASLTMEAGLLLDGITRSLFATADDELRPQMNGIFFDILPEFTTLVASDGHKLVRDRLVTVHSDEAHSFILPKKPSLLLKSILPKEEGDVQISFNERNAKVLLENYRISCQLIEGRYPNYNSVIPSDNPFRVTVDRMAFISALRRVSVFASAASSLIKLHIDNNTLAVSAQDIDFSTSAEESVMCEYNGNPMSIGFNGPFLLEVLNSVASQDVILELADPSRAGVIVPAEQSESEDLIMLLMPMMLQD